jgi:hypothetical protein
MLEVLFYTEKLFPPSGARACSSLPGSPLPGGSVRGSSAPGSPLRANLTQAALAPAFPEPVALSRWSLHRWAVSVLHAEPSTRPVSGAGPGGRAPGPPNYASRRALVSRRLSGPARPLRPRPRPRAGSTLPCQTIQPDNICYCTLLKLACCPLPPCLPHLQPAHHPACAWRFGIRRLGAWRGARAGLLEERRSCNNGG